MKNTPRTPTSLRPEDFDHRLDGYSKLGAAALATAAALVGTTAEAQIQNITQFKIGSGAFTTTAPHASLGYHVNIYLNFKAGNAQGQALMSRGEILFTHRTHGSSSSREAKFYARYVAHSGSKALRLNAGDRISAQPINVFGKYLARFYSNAKSGNFVPNGANAAVTGYIGFRTRFNAHNQNYYGWLRVRVSNDASGNLAAVTFVADANGVYGAVGLPSDHITAGEVAPVPEPVTVATGLALLALGAAGVRELRRRRSATPKTLAN